MKRTTPSTSSNRRRTQQQWQQILTDYHHSGLSHTAYCQQQNISPSTLYCWMKKLPHEPTMHSTGNAPMFVELTPPRALPADSFTIEKTAEATVLPWDVELSLGGGMILRIRQNSCS